MSTESENTRVYGGRWGTTAAIVPMRRHLARELAGELSGKRILEIGPGLRPTAPVAGSYFGDISVSALITLFRAGGNTFYYEGGRIPFKKDFFDVVMAFEVLEHIEEDEKLLDEVRRVMRPGALFVVSVPLYARKWTLIDDTSAHVRRYEPKELSKKLKKGDFVVERYEPRFEKLRPVGIKIGIWILEKLPNISFLFLQRIAFPAYSILQGKFTRPRWTVSKTLDVPSTATGVTVLARLDA